MKRNHLLLSILAVFVIVLPRRPSPVFEPTQIDTRSSMPPPAPTVLPTPVPITYKNMVVGFMKLEQMATWYEINEVDFRDTARKLGITLELSGGRALLSTGRFVAEDFRHFIAEKVDVLVITARELTGWNDLLKEAREAE